MGRGKHKLTDKRRINFLLGFLTSMTEVIKAMLEVMGPETQPMIDMLSKQSDLAQTLVDLRGETYVVVDGPNGEKLAYFEWCELSLPLEAVSELQREIERPFDEA